MEQDKGQHSCHPQPIGRKLDYLLIISSAIIAVFYFVHFASVSFAQSIAFVPIFANSVYDLMNTMWWGILLGILSVGLLSKIPREFIIAALGTGNSAFGIVRATLAGVLLDLCSHGILMVGMKLYERGASVGQVMAFLIASPWNSFSLTFILIALIGIKWTLAFIFVSALIAILSGVIFDYLVERGTLQENPNTIEVSEDFRFWGAAKKSMEQTEFDLQMIKDIFKNGIVESRMVIRWVFFGVVLASLVKTFVSPDQMQTYFGPTIMGLISTLVVATILEICSEGSTPIAADLLTRAQAPGNSFAFLMAGVATDYTEVMSIRDTMHSWKIALFLPLVTLPQILVAAWIMNIMH